MAMTDTEALDWADRTLQAVSRGGDALDALARGEIPADWATVAEDLAMVQSAFHGPSSHAIGIDVTAEDVAALARLRTLVAAGSVGDEVRALAASLRAAFRRQTKRQDAA